jgi:hypothetical protein
VRSSSRTPDLALELLDLPAQRRLGDPQPGGGATEVALLGHGHEPAHVIQ